MTAPSVGLSSGQLFRRAHAGLMPFQGSSEDAPIGLLSTMAIFRSDWDTRTKSGCRLPIQIVPSWFTGRGCPDASMQESDGLVADPCWPWESLHAVPSGFGGATRSACAPGCVQPRGPLENVVIQRRNGPGSLSFQDRRGILLMLFS